MSTSRAVWMRTLAAVSVVLGCIGCDQVSKRVAEDELQGRARISMLADTVRIQYVENSGAFLGLGAQWSPEARFWVLVVGTGLFLIGLGWAIYRNLGQSYYVAALALILGGGASNLIDRMAREGRVIDFMNLGIGPVRTGIFNLADVAITAGVALIILRALLVRDDDAGEDAAV